MSRLSKEDWINAALSLLADKASVGISIVKLAQLLGVTRGSFYYHFESLNDLIDAMIERWESTVIEKGFQEAKSTAQNPEDEISKLIDFVTHLTDKQDQTFRQWAPHNAHVRKHMARLDAKRLAIMTDLFQRFAGDQNKGAAYAKIAFYGYIGCLNSYPRPSAQKQAEVAFEIFNLFRQDLKR